MRHQTDQCAFQFPHVRPDIRSDKQRHICRQSDFFLLGFLLQDGDLGLEVGWLNVSDQSPFKAAAQTVLDFRQLLWGRSLAITICFIDSCRALNVWKNSSWVRSFCARNWISSTNSTSTLRNLSRKLVILS